MADYDGTEQSIALQSTETSAPRVPLWWGILTGLVAAGAGLAAGEVVAGMSRLLRSPIVSVGDRVIDHVPRGLKEWTIRTFGTSDKAVLIVTIVVVIAIAGPDLVIWLFAAI